MPDVDLISHLAQQLPTTPQQHLTTLYVGYSGGLDSTALLVAAAGLRTRMPELEVIGLHIDHQLSPDAGAWVAHCQRVGAQLDVEIRVHQVSVPTEGNLEANAREARYRIFREQLRAQGDLLLLGHHRDDQSETLLLRLLQGRGLLPMQRYRPLGAGGLLRPWLDLTRADLHQAAQGLAWVEDESNRDTTLARNFLRSRIIPELAGFWPNYAAALGRVANAQHANEQALVMLAGRLGDGFPCALLEGATGRDHALLRAYLHAREVFTVSDAALDDFSRRATDAEAARLQVGPSHSLRVHEQMIYWVDETLTLPERTGVDTWIQFGPHRLRVVGPLPTRPDGWQLHPAGEHARERLAGQRLTVSEALRTAKVPSWWRADWPLLADGVDRSDGEERMFLPLPGVPLPENWRLEVEWFEIDKK